MPNWAEGNIRIRGKRDNILEFLRSELIMANDDMGTEHPVIVEENRGGWSIIIKKPKLDEDSLYFRGSERQFIMDFKDPDMEIEMSEGPNKNVDQIIILDNFNGAWAVDSDTFRDYAKRYKLDIRIFVWELGMCWSQCLTFYKDGRTDSEYRHYANWLWDSPMPFYGG